MDLLVLVKENLKSKKSTFIGLTILMVIISFILITVISVNNNIDDSMDNAHKYIDSGDVYAWIQQNDDNENIIDKIKSLDYVKRVKVRDMVDVSLDINNTKYGKDSIIGAYGNPKLKIYNDSGNGFIDNDQINNGEIFLPIAFKTNYNLKLGDIVHIKVKDQVIDFKVKRFIQEPLAGSSMMGLKIMYISQDDLDMLLNMYDENCKKNNCVYKYKYAEIYSKEKMDDSDFSMNLNRDTKIADNSSFTLTKSESIYYHTVFNQILSGFLYSFAIILTIIVIIVISYSINNSIEMEYKSIGILKSIGISNRKIRLALIIEYLIVCLIGSIIGGLLSLLGIKYLCSLLVNITGILPSFSINIFSILLVILLIILILLFIIVKTIKVSKISPLKAITSEGIRINNSKVKNKITSKLLNVKLAIRQIFSNVTKYISIIFISSTLVFVMILISSLNNELQSGRVLDSLGLVPYDIYVNEDNKEYDKVEKIINKYSKIETRFNYSGWYFTLDNYQYYGQVTTNFDVIKNLTEGRKPKNKDEIIVTKLVSDKIHKYIGDKVTVTFDNNSHVYKIVGYYQSTSDVGKCFMMSDESMRILYPELSFNSYDYKLVDSTKSRQITEELNKVFKDSIYINDATNDSDFNMIQDIFKILNVITYLIAVVFIIVSIILISHRMLVFEEQTFGIYKAVGFNANKLRLQFSLRFLFVSVIGTIIGGVFNVIFNDQVLILLLKGMGLTNYKSEISIMGILIPILFVNICFFIFTYFMSRKIKKVSTNKLIIE